jgi:hypothetical protein
MRFTRLGMLFFFFSIFTAHSENTVSLRLRVIDTQEPWETMGYTYGMTNPKGQPLGIYVHSGPASQVIQMLYRGLLPLGEHIFQFVSEVPLAISMEASIINPDPTSQCYVTQYVCGEMYVEGNCYRDEKNTVVMSSNLPFQVEHKKLLHNIC